ncbi:hypothetical protein RJ639_036085 [Escallonia herrerae]|uniref:Peptide transporter n=1 Tax=Escallonia herrerae TaxID=1293975 RepID=A0AA88WPC9_9ASTE|nr:hypothetical protein RJ639_036085 [Escallonia herrerae]
MELLIFARLSQSSVVAVNNVTSCSGTRYVTPLLRASLADAYLGRYWIIAIFSIIYVFVRLYLIALGTGGIKPCVSSFGADQFDDSDEVEKKSKSSFFNWFYLSINIGALGSATVLVWIQTNVGWGWGFGIPAVAMAAAVVSFFLGTRLYCNLTPGGSPLSRIFQVIVASCRKAKVKAPKENSLLFETSDEESTVKGSRKLDHTKQLRYRVYNIFLETSGINYLKATFFSVEVPEDNSLLYETSDKESTVKGSRKLDHTKQLRADYLAKTTMGIDEDDVYTKDGTVDIRNQPAVKRKTGTWKACPFILGNECCERLAYYGMSTNLVNYLKDRLNQSSVTASNNVTNWSGTCYVTPLIGAFLADAYFGRYWTIALFSMIYVCGMTLLTISASVKGLTPTCEKDVCHPNKSQTGVFFAALYLIALGTGGIKPCVSTFGADQFDENDKSEKEKKSSFFNWFYLSINVGALVASSVLVWIQMNVGWGWGFGVPAVAMAVAVMSFFSGSRLYRIQKPGGSPLTRILQVLVASVRKSDVRVPENKSLLYETADEKCAIEGSRKLEHTEMLKFFDRAALETETDRVDGVASPWKLCTVTQVEELKSVIRLLPVWASGIIFSAVYSQMSTMFVLQGDTMDQHIGPNFKIPAASLSLFDTLSVIFWAPVYDRVIVGLARKFTGHKSGFTQLQRMGIGLVISIFAMIVAGVLEVVRLDYVRRNNYFDLETIPMSIFWQVPQYFLIGCAEVFTFIGQIEFFYDQAPDAMRSLMSALSLTTNALGNYLSTLLVTIVTNVTTRHGHLGWIPDNLNKGHLDYFYWLLAILSLINFFVYLGIAKWYTYKKPRVTEASF